MKEINPTQLYTLRQIHKMKIFKCSYTALYNLTTKVEDGLDGRYRVLRNDADCLKSKNYAHPMNKNMLIKVLGSDIIEFLSRYKSIMKKKFQEKTPGRKIQSENMKTYWKNMTKEKLQLRMEKVMKTREINKRERDALLKIY